jgi:multidrug resistance efflux pump
MDLKDFKAMNYVQLPNWIETFSRTVGSFIIFTVLILAIVPWQQTSQGSGGVIAFDPNDRVQDINSAVSGRINKWFVQDGSKVKQGEPIAEIVDNDPNFVERLNIERDAVLKKYEAAKAATETAQLNYRRQEKLYEEGLSARTKFEKAKIEYKKLLAAEASAAANLAKAEVRLSRQERQLITAPRDGTILRVLHGSGSVFVKEGDTVAIFVPDTLKPAVEIFIDGNDLPLVYPGRHVRLQFEGWPAVQFSGWPSIAVGTFGGVVKVVDPSATYKGKFRVIIVPEEDEVWPNNTYLRQGTRVYGWVLLNRVQLGYELWRQFNGFPPALDAPPELLLKKAKKDKKKKKDKDYKEIYK